MGDFSFYLDKDFKTKEEVQKISDYRINSKIFTFAKYIETSVFVSRMDTIPLNAFMKTYSSFTRNSLAKDFGNVEDVKIEESELLLIDNGYKKEFSFTMYQQKFLFYAYANKDYLIQSFIVYKEGNEEYAKIFLSRLKIKDKVIFIKYK